MSTEALILASGAFLGLMALVSAWLFRTASAPFFVRLIIPVMLLVATCATPFQLPSILGWPVETTFAALPQQAELLAFHPYDDEKKVDLWLMSDGAPQPRAYSVDLTDDLKDTLRKAQKAKANGGRAMLAKVAKTGGKKRPAYMDIDGGSAPYVLLPDAFQLPKKDATQ